jgi:hypothetical protein
LQPSFHQSSSRMCTHCQFLKVCSEHHLVRVCVQSTTWSGCVFRAALSVSWSGCVFRAALSVSWSGCVFRAPLSVSRSGCVQSTTQHAGYPHLAPPIIGDTIFKHSLNFTSSGFTVEEGKQLLALWLGKGAQELSPHCEDILKYCRCSCYGSSVPIASYIHNTKKLLKVT